MSFHFLRRRQNFSSSSTSTEVPELHSPSTYLTAAAMEMSQPTPKLKEQSVKGASTGSMFMADKEDDEEIEVIPARRTPAKIETGRLPRKSVEEGESSAKKTQSFGDAFATRVAHNSLREIASQEFMVVIEIKTNQKIKENESQLVTDISVRMAEIYQKPENLIVVTIQQGACLLFGCSEAPAYLVKVFALPYLIAPLMNVRNTALIQSALLELLRIPLERGVIVFVSVSEQNMGTNGVTARGVITEQERTAQEAHPGILKTITRTVSRRLRSTSEHESPISPTTAASWAAFTADSNKPAVATEKAIAPEKGTVSAQGTATEQTTPTVHFAETVQETTIPEQGTEDESTTDHEKEAEKIRKRGSLRKFISRRLSELGAIADKH